MRFACFLLVFALLVVAARAEEPAPPPRPAAAILPDLPSANMYLSWDDFCRILDMLAAARAKDEAPPESEPPVEWSLVAAHYDADADASHARIEAGIKLKIWKQGWIQAPVVGAEVALESAELDGEPVALIQQTGWLAVMLDEPGDHEIRLVFHVPCRQTEGVGEFSFKCARTPVTRMELNLDTRNVEVRAGEAAERRFRNTTDGTSADFVFRGTDEINISWQLPPDALPAVPPKEPPRISCLGSTLATVTETHVACRSTLQYDVLRGEAARFDLALPPGVNILRLEGNGIGWNVEEEDGRQKIAVNVNHAITDHFVLTVDYEVPLKEGTATVTVPRLDVLDVARYSGFIALATRGNVEIDESPESSGVQRVDTVDLPAGLEMQSPDPILHAFRHNEPDYLLALTYKKLAEVPVRVAGIEAASVTSMLTEQGVLVTRAAYQVRNNLKKFLRVNLGPAAEVWGAQVAGVPVRPARDNGENAAAQTGEVVLIPLRKSSEAGGGVFNVDIVYARNLKPENLWDKPFEAAAPVTDLLADRFQWQVFMPENRYVYHVSGDLKPVKDTKGLRAAMHNRATAGRAMETQAWEHRPETIYRMREGIERFYITDINNPAASAGVGSKPRYDGAQSNEAADRAAAVRPIDTRVAGVLPIPVSFPVQGSRRVFERLLVPQDTPLKLTFHTVDARAVSTVRHGMWLFPLAGGLLAGLAWRRTTRGRRNGAVHLALLVVFTAAALVAALAAAGLFKMIGLYVLAAASVRVPGFVRRRLGFERQRRAETTAEEA